MKSREQIEFILDNLICGYAYHRIITDGKGESVDYVFLEVNKAYEQLTGLKKENIIGKRVTEVFPGIKDMKFDWIGTYGKVALTGKSIVFEQSFEPHDNIYRISACCPERGCFAVSFEDMTEQKKAEISILKNRGQLAYLVDNVIDTIIVTDKGGIIKFVNKAACDLFGRERDELLGAEFGFPITLEKIIEINITPSDGEIRYAEAKSTLIDWDGEQSYLLSIRDITERKRAMEEREQMNNHLQQIDKIESIGNLAGGIAHDFNNMLSIILGYGQEILSSLNPTDPLHESAKEIVEAGKRSADLTKQLLAFSRRQALQPEVMDLSIIVNNVESMLRRLIGEDIELTIKLADKLDHVEIDPSQIEQVIVNMAVNARDAMPQGGHLTIETANFEFDDQYTRTHHGAIPGRYAMLSMTDSGRGMNKEILGKVFEPFYTTKGKGKGTGLGLSTVYGIVKQSGGNIYAYSEPGHGTTFKIYLPSTSKKLPEESERDHISSLKGKGEMILVVEDETSLRKYCEKTLKALNYMVTVAANGGGALSLIEEKKLCPDLILTDVVMPKMSGKELIDRVKETLPDIKVLYMSGYTDNAILHHGVLDKETPFIQKPFTRNKLGIKLRSILD